MTAIIFVQERTMAVALASLLIKIADMQPDEYGHLRVGYAVGSTSNNFFKAPQSEELKLLAEQELLKLQKTLDAFRCKRLNLLVSTSVLEEGIDITQCNLVIRFDRIQEFRSYVQSKGRARAKPSRFIVMTEEGEQTSQWRKDYEN